jgi:hypothetical protein
MRFSPTFSEVAASRPITKSPDALGENFSIMFNRGVLALLKSRRKRVL